MIAFVKGRLVEAGTTAVVAVGDGGVGLTVLLSARAATSLPPVGETVKLWTHLAMREDGWTLYGFPWTEEREMFLLLVSVNGIGPKVALNILSSTSPANLALQLRSGDEKGLTRLPGIGKKSAARMIVELGQRIPDDLAGGAVSPGARSVVGDDLAPAVSVLTAMGLSPSQAEGALMDARAEDADLPDDLERWVKAALARL